MLRLRVEGSEAPVMMLRETQYIPQVVQIPVEVRRLMVKDPILGPLSVTPDTRIEVTHDGKVWFHISLQDAAELLAREQLDSELDRIIDPEE
jgi:hypothetical protein